MSRRRFFAPPDAFQNGTVTLRADEARHLRDVLRLKHGDEVYVFDGLGREFRCSVAAWKRDEVMLVDCEEVKPPSPESALNFTLAVALLKGDKFDLVVQKATELGVSSLVPVMTRHADVHLRQSGDSEKRVKRWQRIALEAAKQCGRAKVPEVEMPVDIAELLTVPKDSLRLMFAERDGESLADSLKGLSQPESLIALIGSEGGWSDDEIQQARALEWRIITLTGRVLRAETAAIAVSVLLQHRFGDLH